MRAARRAARTAGRGAVPWSGWLGRSQAGLGLAGPCGSSPGRLSGGRLMAGMTLVSAALAWAWAWLRCLLLVNSGRRRGHPAGRLPQPPGLGPGLDHPVGQVEHGRHNDNTDNEQDSHV